jgi:hypothetical protein
MVRSLCTAVLSTFSVGVAHAQALETTPLSPEAIWARGGQPMPRVEVLGLVSDSKIVFLWPAGGERRWTSKPDGTVSANQIGFNPHWKTGRGTWLVRDDGTYCATLDYSNMEVWTYCLGFFTADGQTLLSLDPVIPGLRVFLKH